MENLIHLSRQALKWVYRNFMTDENEDILSSDENNLISIRRKKLSEIRTKRQAFP